MGAAHKVGLPIQVYPFYENAYRSRHGQSIQENIQESAKLYGDFAKVAEQLPTAWHYGRPAETEQSIGTVTKRNRMICFPCKQPACPPICSVTDFFNLRPTSYECLQYHQSCRGVPFDFHGQR